MKEINVVGEKMPRNGLKMTKWLSCAFHFELEFILENTVIQKSNNFPGVEYAVAGVLMK